MRKRRRRKNKLLKRGLVSCIRDRKTRQKMVSTWCEPHIHLAYSGNLARFLDDGSFRLFISLESPLYKKYIEGVYRQDPDDPSLWVPIKKLGE